MLKVWRNPYNIDENIRLEFRDSRKRFSTPGKARFYYLYYNGVLVKVGQFPSNFRVIDKEQVITDEINLIYAQEINQDYDEEKQDSEDLAFLLYGDLLQFLSKADPRTFQELISEPVPIEKEIPEDEFEDPEFEQPFEEDEELSDLLYRDLLQLLSEEEPVTFEEVTGKKLPLLGKTRTRKKNFNQYTVNGQTQKGTARNDFYIFKLDRPINLATKDPDTMIDVVKKYLIHPMKRVFDRRKKGENFFLLSILYKQNQKDADGNIIEVDRGISIQRFKAKNWQEFIRFVTDPETGLFSAIQSSYTRYLEASVDNTITTLGFKLEHMYSFD